MSTPTEIMANRVLHQLSGVRAGTLPMVLATRLAEALLLHAEHTICPGCDDNAGPHDVCDGCDRTWPCPTYRVLFDGTGGWPA